MQRNIQQCLMTWREWDGEWNGSNKQNETIFLGNEYL